MNLEKEIIKNLEKVKEKDRGLVRKVKRRVCRKYGKPLPKNTDLLSTYRKMVKKREIEKNPLIKWLLITRPVRSLSGIVNVTVLTKPFPCPGQCIFCPNEPGFPKSYLAGEPAADRAKGLDFDPYRQVSERLKSLRAQGHPVEKIELRIVGGTWSAYPEEYKRNFLKGCFEAANTFPEVFKTEKTLSKLQKENEKAKSRIVGLSIETRPDHINREEIRSLRESEVTFVEIGAQTVFDEIHRRCQTNLSVEKISRATRLLKDAGFKVLWQVMPGLPGSNLKKDLEMFEIIFKDPRFKPDWLKIYPCLVCENTKLHQLWKEGSYKPYSQKELIELLKKARSKFPRWVRVARIFRDIPAEKIKGGCTTSNLRELLDQEQKCGCIRCREVKDRFDPEEDIFLFREDYEASGGKEVFLSFENKKRTKLFSLLRLRLPGEEIFPLFKNSGIIREVQTFGPQIPLTRKGKGAQHKGLGRKLIKKAEEIAKNEFNKKKMVVISGVGVREYYRQKHNYHLEKTYMSKKLNS